MSTTESNRNSSQGKQESSKQGNSTRAKHSQSDERRKPLPFDDDDTGGAEGSSQVPDTNGQNTFV